MANFSAKIFNNAISALNSQQAIIANTGNNIANANTPGFTRRVVDLKARVDAEGRSGNVTVGGGVEIGSIKRFVDEFVNQVHYESIADKFSTEAINDIMDRAQDLFSFKDGSRTIGTALSNFYQSLEDLTADPSSIELRSSLISAGEDLVTAIKTTYNGLADLQDELDKRLSVEVDALNTLTTQIAELNGNIVQAEVGGNVAADDRDQREQLLQQLAEKLDYNIREEADGSNTIYLDSGFELVFGTTSKDLRVTAAPSFGGPIDSLSGGSISFVTFNFGTNASPADINLTSEITGGTVGGIINVRGLPTTADTSAFDATGFLPELASRVEAITRDLLVNFNTQYLGPDEDTSTAGVHDPSSADLDGNSPGVFGFFDFVFAGTKDVDSDGLPDDVGNHTGIDNYSSILQMTISDPRDVAAALDQDATDSSTSFVSGDGDNIERLLGLQTSSRTFSAGNYSQTATTIEEIYNQAVSYVGNEKSRAEVNANVAEQNLVVAANQRDSISAVNLDEEFTNLIRFQQAFQASARILQVGRDLLDQVVNLI